MNVLIVGAGSVGQVYGRHLERGGARVSYWVKSRYADEVRQGFVFYPLNRARAERGRAERQAVAPEQVLVSAAEVAAQRWDQIYLCISSPALRGAWLDELARCVGDATVVVMQPGADDAEYVRQRIPPAQVVVSGITLISYHAPLETRRAQQVRAPLAIAWGRSAKASESLPEPGMAYWFPPLAPSPVRGARASSVVSALRRGGLPARVVRGDERRTLFATTFFMPFLSALEASGWSFHALGRGDALDRACAAGSEAAAIVAAEHGTSPPLWQRAIAPSVLRLALAIAPPLAPFDVEAVLFSHFTKVREQTRFLMQGYIAAGRARNLPTGALEALEAAVQLPSQAQTASAA